MKNLKKILRVFVLMLLIMLALSGIGIAGALLANNRERYRNKENTIEMFEQRERKTENSETDQRAAES